MFQVRVVLLTLSLNLFITYYYKLSSVRFKVCELLLNARHFYSLDLSQAPVVQWLSFAGMVYMIFSFLFFSVVRNLRFLLVLFNASNIGALRLQFSVKPKTVNSLHVCMITRMEISLISHQNTSYSY